MSFAKFEQTEQPKLKNVAVFGKGVDVYNNLTMQIIQELDADITRSEAEDRQQKLFKEV